MKKSLLFFLASWFLHLGSFAQTPYWNWAKHAGGTNYDEASVLITNNTGNLTVSGFFRGTAWFPTDTFTAGLSNAMFISEYDLDGNMLWVKHVADASGGIFPEYLFQDADDNYYVVGTFGAYSFGGSVTFFPSTSFTSDGHSDIFIAKFSSDATLLWAQAIRSTENPTAAYTAALDDDNNVFVAGTLFGQHIFTSTLNDTIFSDSNWHIYLAEYASSGTLSGVNNIIKNPQVMYPVGMTTDPGNNVYLTGKYNGKPLFGIEPDTFSIAESPFYDALFISRFGDDGIDARWAYPGASASGHYPFTLDADDDNNLIVSGLYSLSTTLTSASGSVTLTPPAGSEIFLAAYDTTGVIQWAKNAGHSSGGGITINDVALYHSSRICLTGNYTGSPTFGEGSSTSYIPYANDLYVAQYDESGTLEYAQRGGGASGENSYSLTLDEFDNPYIAGNFNLAAVFDSTATLDITLTSYGYTDILVAKLDDNIFVGQEELTTAKTELNIYPNPANETLNIISNEPLENLEIYNSSGQLVTPSTANVQWIFERDSDGSKGQSLINVSLLAEGIYFLRAQSANTLFSEKIMILR